MVPLSFGRSVHEVVLGLPEVGLGFGPGVAGGVGEVVPQGIEPVDGFSGRVGALHTPFARGLKGFVGGGGECLGTD